MAKGDIDLRTHWMHWSMKVSVSTLPTFPTRLTMCGVQAAKTRLYRKNCQQPWTRAQGNDG